MSDYRLLFKQRFPKIIMKIVKIEEKSSSVNRKIVSNFGKTIYQCPEVKAVFIKVAFKDGSSIGFSKDEDDDNLDCWIGEEGE